MVVIRLSRVGKKKQPSYRIVVQDRRHDPWSPHIELLGHYNPLTEPATLDVQKERVTHWLSKGAQPSATLWNLFLDHGIVTGNKRRTIRISKVRRDKLAAKQGVATNAIAEPATNAAPAAS